MKKLSLLILLSTLFIVITKAEKIKGKIIYSNDSIVNVVFNIPFNNYTAEIDFQSLQYKVTYFDAKGEKIKLHPGFVKEIQFTYSHEKIRMISRIYKHDFIFLKLAIDGHLKLYDYYYTQITPGMSNPMSGTMSVGSVYSVDSYLLEKENDELTSIRKSKFKKDMCKYFSDCSLLIEKIKEKEFGKEDIEAIVRFYNSKCN